MNVYQTLMDNSADFYVILRTDGTNDLLHVSQLSAILQCGAEMSDYGISEMQPCWGGIDLGEDCINPNLVGEADHA